MKQFFFGNLGTKIMALVLAVLMWVYLYGSSVAGKTLKAPFEPRLALSAEALDNYYIRYACPEGALRPGTSAITARISGPRADIETVREAPFRLQITEELFRGDEGIFTHVVSLKDFGLSEKFTLESVVPKEISVDYQRFVDQEVRLEVGLSDVDGKPAPGFVIEEVTCDKDRIIVRVPKREEGKLTRVGVERIPLGGNVTESFTLADWRIHTAEPYKVKLGSDQTFLIHVKVRQEVVSKTLSNLDLAVEAAPDLYPRIELNPTTITVKVTGPPNEIAKLSEADIVVFASVHFKLAPGEKRTLPANEILGHRFRDPKLHKVLDVEYMPDLEEATREVTVSLSEKEP